MTAGERMKNLRERLGISQVEFAEKINVSKQTLYKYENNLISNIPSDKIEAAAKAAHVSPAYIMGWEEEKNPETKADADFSLKAADDSMSGARIQKGDTVFVRRQNVLPNGSVAAFAIDGSDTVLLRRIYRYPDRGLLILRAENPDFEDLIFQTEEQNRIKILGKAVAFQSELP